MIGLVPISMTVYSKWNTKKMEWNKTSFTFILKWTSPPESMKSSETRQETQREAILGHSPRTHWSAYVGCQMRQQILGPQEADSVRPLYLILPA